MKNGELNYRYSEVQKPKNHISFDTLRVIKDPQKRQELLMCAHEELGLSREAKALGGHVGRHKTLSTNMKIIDSGST